jgi:hypothetical protein
VNDWSVTRLHQPSECSFCKSVTWDLSKITTDMDFPSSPRPPWSSKRLTGKRDDDLLPAIDDIRAAGLTSPAADRRWSQSARHRSGARRSMGRQSKCAVSSLHPTLLCDTTYCNATTARSAPRECVRRSIWGFVRVGIAEVTHDFTLVLPRCPGSRAVRK